MAVIGAGRPDEVRLPPARATTRPRAFVDREVVLGIRPECIAEGGRAFADDPRAVVVDAPVEMIEPTGAETIVLLRLGGEPAAGARRARHPACRPARPRAFALDTRTHLPVRPRRRSG